MKKGVVILLVVVALVVLITPGIIGHLAEESIDQNLEIAVSENEDVVVSSLGFVRGWFSSEGQHRIEIRDRTSFSGPGEEPRYADALIVTTRIDHGLIPVTSMAREEGSLAPGLGSAVSTFSLEMSDGSSYAIPGTVYSEIGLTGELQSNFVLDADSADVNVGTLAWGDTDVLVTTNAATGMIAANGEMQRLDMTVPDGALNIGGVAFAGEQQPGRFGYPLGFIDVDVNTLYFETPDYDISVGPVLLDSNIGAVGERVDAAVQFEAANFRSTFGDANIVWHARLEGADGEALGNVTTFFDKLANAGTSPAGLDDIVVDSIELLGQGFELHFDRLDVQLPQGSLSSQLHLNVLESNADAENWVAVIMALDGTLELSLSQGLVDWITGVFPEFGGVVALGYLRKSGDLYETLIEVRSGVITINGAPMQIPLDMLQ